MSKKVSSVDPLSLLREYISNNKPIKQADENLYFGQTKLPINTPTAWNPKVTDKQYSLGDLWLFLDSQRNPDKYPENKYYEEMRKYNLQIVSTHDKEEIVNYFTGKIEDSEAINQELKASIKINKDGNKKKPTKPKTEDESQLKKKIKTDDEKKDARENNENEEKKDGDQEMNEEAKASDNLAKEKEKENIKLMDLLFRFEKPIESRNRALRKLNKSFKSVLNYFTAEARTAAETSQANIAKKANMTKLDEILNQGGGLDESNPIILVLGAPTPGGLSLENAREFLEKGEYKDPSMIKKDLLDQKKHVIYREFQGKRIAFEVMGDAAQIRKDNLWPRVLAIFVTGYTHQFQGWPDGDRVSVLFSKKRAYHMKYHDVPLHDNIKKWNVKLLEIHRNRRYLDATTKNHFWEDLESFMIKPPS